MSNCHSCRGSKTINHSRHSSCGHHEGHHNSFCKCKRPTHCQPRNHCQQHNCCSTNDSRFSHHAKRANCCDFFDDRFLCSDKFRLRLNGLESGMIHKLHQLKHCKVKMEIGCGKKCELIKAKIECVGSDFVEVKVLNAKKNKKKSKFLIVPIDSIKWIEQEQKKRKKNNC